jgi:hypothetical protein
LNFMKHTQSSAFGQQRFNNKTLVAVTEW